MSQKYQVQDQDYSDSRKQLLYLDTCSYMMNQYLDILQKYVI